MRKSVKVKIPAKINLTLDITGKQNGFHNIESLVASVEIYDAITLCKRDDNNITLTETNILSGCEQEQNNAVKCYKILQQEYNLCGVDITIDKNIPVGAGLGGSSADIAGVIKGVEQLFNITIDKKKIADLTGSDVLYMIDGGYAVISGRGNNVRKLNVDKTLYINIIDNQKVVSAKDSYTLFDKMQEENKGLLVHTTTLAEDKLINNEMEFYSLLKNDLEAPSKELAPIINTTLTRFTNANARLMTGSGSAVIGVYDKKSDRDKDYKKLKPIFVDRLIKTQTK